MGDAEVNGDVGIVVLVYDPQLQQDSLLCCQVPEKGAELVLARAVSEMVAFSRWVHLVRI